MSFQQHLLELGDLLNFSELSTFTQNIPVEWVESALHLSTQATIRRRRLPADQVLWLVLGMALFRDEPVHEVARPLNICAQGLASDQLLARSGVTEARKRLGADPVEWLLRKTGSQWGGERYSGDNWQDLQVFAVDGALLRTADTPELRDHFGSGNTSTERQTPFPMMRLVALMNVRSHLILDAQLSPYRRSEMRLADEFLRQIPNDSVTLFDKGFWSADLLLSLATAGDNRLWLIPARKNLVSEEVIRYSKQDRLLRMKVSPQARKHNPDLPTHWDVRETADGQGLYLQVGNSGAASWLYRFQLAGNRRHMGLGSCDSVTLAEAREKVSEARKRLAAGIEPLAARNAELEAQRVAERLKAAKSISFQTLATDYVDVHGESWSAKWRRGWMRKLQLHAFPKIGALPAASIGVEQVLQVLKPIWTDKTRTADEVRGQLEQVLDAAKVRGLWQGENPARWKGNLENLLSRARQWPARRADYQRA